MSETTIGLSKDVKNRLEPLKNEWGGSWDEFMNDLIRENVDIEPENLDELTAEKQERVEQTRATAVGLLKALDEADMVDEAVDIIREMSQQRMLAEHQKIIQHFLQKSRNGEPPNEMDELLARVIINTESTREQETAAAEIARGMFNESTTAERTTTREASKAEDGESESSSTIGGSSISIKDEQMEPSDSSTTLMNENANESAQNE